MQKFYLTKIAWYCSFKTENRLPYMFKPQILGHASAGPNKQVYKASTANALGSS